MSETKTNTTYSNPSFVKEEKIDWSELTETNESKAMKTILKECTTNKFGFRTSSENQQLKAMEEYSNQQNQELQNSIKFKDDYIEKLTKDLNTATKSLSEYNDAFIESEQLKRKFESDNQELQRQVDDQNIRYKSTLAIITKQYKEEYDELQGQVEGLKNIIDEDSILKHNMQSDYTRLQSQYTQIKEAADEMAYTDTETPEGKLARAKYKQLTQKQNG